MFIYLRKTSCAETCVMGWLQRNQIRKKYATWSSNGRRLQLYNHTNRSGYSYTAGCHPFFFSWSKLLKFPFFIKWDTVCKKDYKRKIPKAVFLSLIIVYVLTSKKLLTFQASIGLSQLMTSNARRYNISRICFKEDQTFTHFHSYKGDCLYSPDFMA